MTTAASSAAALPAFITAAEAFYARHGRDPLFSLLSWVLRCGGEEERALVVKRLYCQSIPENTYEPREPRQRAFLALLLLPLKVLLARRLFWTPARTVDYQLETITPDYFSRWFEGVFAVLPGLKRITPRSPADFGRYETTAGTLASTCLSDALRLSAAAPALALLTWRLSRRCGLDLATAVRKTVSVYVTFRGYFRRFPTRHFITYADESNSPGRWLAFKQSSAGKLVVVQNGERVPYPTFAYGAMDLYIMFGEEYVRMLESVRCRSGRFEVSGALCLNEHHPRLAPLLARREPPAFDLLVIDQSVSHNGLPDGVNETIKLMFAHIGRYQTERPGLRTAFQLRPYPSADGPASRAAVAAARSLLPGAEVLENLARGDSYVNGLRARLVVTFHSTIGFELLRLGQPVLFVNLTSDPLMSICGDPRFQFEDPSGDYAAFARRLDQALLTELSAPPEAAMRRHPFFDGKVQERLFHIILQETR